MITRLAVKVLDMIRILNVCLVGTPGGPTVWVIRLADLFPYLTAVSLVHHIYTPSVSSLEDAVGAGASC
jgi:hypothetical protein